MMFKFSTDAIIVGARATAHWRTLVSRRRSTLGRGNLYLWAVLEMKLLNKTPGCPNRLFF